MKKNVPIYLSNITVQKVKKNHFGIEVLEEKILKKVIVKGFDFKDIIKRKKEKFSREAFPKGLNNKELMVVKKIDLISQHGFGVDK